MPNQTALKEQVVTPEQIATHPKFAIDIVKRDVKAMPETVEAPTQEQVKTVSEATAQPPVDARVNEATVPSAEAEKPIELTDKETAADTDNTDVWLASLAVKNNETKEYKDPVGAEFRKGIIDAYDHLSHDVERSNEHYEKRAAEPSMAGKQKVDTQYHGEAKLPEGFQMSSIGEHREELERMLPAYRKMVDLGLKPRIIMEVNGLDREHKSTMLEGLALPNGNISAGIVRSDLDSHRKSTGHDLGVQFSLISDEKLSLRPDGQRDPSQSDAEYGQAINKVASLLGIPKEKVDSRILRSISPDDDTYVSFVRDCAEHDPDALLSDLDGDGSIGTVGKTMVKAPEGGFRPGIFKINEEENAIELASQDVAAYSTYRPGIGIRVAFKGTELIRAGKNLLMPEEPETKERKKAEPKTLGSAASGIVSGEDGYGFEDKTPAELKQEIAELKEKLDSDNSAALHGLPIKYVDKMLSPFAAAQDRPAEKRIPEIKEFADVIQNEKFKHRLELRANAGDNPQVVVAPVDTTDRADWLDRLSAGDRKKYFGSEDGFVAAQKLLTKMSERAASNNGSKQYALLITSRPRKGFEIAGLSTNGEIVDEWFPTSKTTKKA